MMKSLFTKKTRELDSNTRPKYLNMKVEKESIKIVHWIFSMEEKWVLMLLKVEYFHCLQVVAQIPSSSSCNDDSVVIIIRLLPSDIAIIMRHWSLAKIFKVKGVKIVPQKQLQQKLLIPLAQVQAAKTS